MRYLAVSVLVLSLLGCTTTETVFVVSRDVPENPVFTVVGSGSTELANATEEALIQLGVKTVLPPAPKEVVKETDVQSGEAAQEESSVEREQAGITITERFVDFEVEGIDYVVEVSALNDRIKLYKTDTREVLTSFTLAELQKTALTSKELQEWRFLKAIHDALAAAGVDVRPLPPKPEQSPASEDEGEE